MINKEMVRDKVHNIGTDLYFLLNTLRHEYEEDSLIISKIKRSLEVLDGSTSSEILASGRKVK